MILESDQQSLSLELTVQKRKRQPILKAELTKHVTDLYDRDDVGRCMTGQRDAENVEGGKKQIRILNGYLANIPENIVLKNRRWMTSGR